MKINLKYDEIDDRWIAELTNLTEKECDAARNQNVGFKAIEAGAIGWGTEYRPSQNVFKATVRAYDEETSKQAAEEYYTAIQTELSDEN